MWYMPSRPNVLSETTMVKVFRWASPTSSFSSNLGKPKKELCFKLKGMTAA